MSILGGFGVLIGCAELPSSPEISTGDVANTDDQKTGDRLNITVSVLPQKYFVEKIGGDRVTVDVMVGEGVEAETYEPKPQQLKALSAADVYIGTGIFFEDIWQDRLRTANSKMTWVDAATGVEKLAIADHHHEHHGHHDDELLDPHIWLSPQRVKKQAENIFKSFVELDPEHELTYAENLARFLDEIDSLDREITERLAQLDSRTFLVFHPAWGYFADDYNLEQIAIEVEGQEPSAAELAELIKVAQAENIRVIFAQYQFNSQTAQTIATEIGAEVVYIDPLSADWAANLLAIADQFVLANNN